MVDRATIARLRRLCEEEPRTPLSRSGPIGVPSPATKVLHQHSEISRLRAGLIEALAIIETMEANG